MRVTNKNGTRLLPATLFSLLLMTLVAIPTSGRAHERLNPNVDTGSIVKDVRHQLLMLPYYGVFDDLQFEVQADGTVVLSGEVVRPYLKSDAVNAVQRLQGSGKVVDKIEVLPLSTYDDRLRIALYRSIFHNVRLDRYALGAVPSIHIIVRNGTVQLTGVVATKADKNVAGIMANVVPGIFSVTNNLQVEK
jgi:hyperosmotically inducible protein